MRDPGGWKPHVWRGAYGQKMNTEQRRWDDGATAAVVGPETWAVYAHPDDVPRGKVSCWAVGSRTDHETIGADKALADRALSIYLAQDEPWDGTRHLAEGLGLQRPSRPDGQQDNGSSPDG